jgi:hypothetical protein
MICFLPKSSVLQKAEHFNEILRVLDSMQLTAAYQVSTPVNWNNGDDVIIPAALPEADAREKYPVGLKIVKPYLRFVPQPGMN